MYFLQHFSIFEIAICVFNILLYTYALKKQQVKWQANLSENIYPYNIAHFINNHLHITAKAANFLIGNNITSYLNNFKFIKPNQAETEYHTIFPFHSDGKSKKELNYRQYFNDESVFIKHYSKYLDNEDNFENDVSISRILTRNCKEDNELIKKLAQKKYTLIYLITLTLSSSFLIREIRAMSHPDIAFILFIDNKSNRTEIYNHFLKMDESLYRLFDNVYFLDSPRFQIGWGRITQALSQAVLMFATIKYFSNSMYLSFHSESDYPIVPNEVILKYLRLHYPNNYMEIIPKSEQELKFDRITSVAIFINESGNLIDSIKYLFPKRIIPSFPWSQGANWFTFTISDSKKIINTMLKNFSIIEHLDYCFHVDEVLFQTLAAEAKIRTQNYFLRYIDWTQGGNNPKTLDEKEFQNIIENPCNFWARKFNNNQSQKVLQMIDDYIIKIKKSKRIQMCS